MDGDHLADLGRSCRSSIDRSPRGPDIPRHLDADQATFDLGDAQTGDIGRLDRRIESLDGSDQAINLDQAQRLHGSDLGIVSDVLDCHGEGFAGGLAG